MATGIKSFNPLISFANICNPFPDTIVKRSTGNWAVALIILPVIMLLWICTGDTVIHFGKKTPE